MLTQEKNKLVFFENGQTLWIEPHGDNALRVRATMLNKMPDTNWALTEPVKSSAKISIDEEKGATIVNGKIKAHVTPVGKITMYDTSTGKLLLEEYMRNRKDVRDPKCSALEVEAREFKTHLSTDSYKLTARFESLDRNEKIYGMGQYQQENLDLKGLDIEMANRNSQATVPFAVSSLGYGLLWNNPAIGRAVFGKNIMSFEAWSTKALDYWVVAGSNPAEILEAYGKAVGTVPMMPEYGLGFWQCKLRYETQEELLNVAREYKKRNLPIDVIVVDFFHWPLQGDWRFDPKYWPDPKAMVKELKDMGIELMVSIWPTVDRRSENFQEMVRKGLLCRADRGIRYTHDFEGITIHADFTNPEARKYVWEKAKKNYHDLGIKVFWLDEAEPEFSAYDYDNYSYDLGPVAAIGNFYPRDYARCFYEGQEAAGQKQVVNLLRCAWAGSQKYGALVWSGDIASSWGVFRSQLSAGLNMGMAGIPWWTTDIGGFHGGDIKDPKFHELLVRWFQWGAFCPVMRLHGDREPHDYTRDIPAPSGGDNEVWTYGEEVYEICKKYMLLREKLRDYTRGLMKAAHEKGSPVMRPCFFDFPNDETAWEVEDQYMYGPKYLCAPIFEAGQKERKVYLPKGTVWQEIDKEEKIEGGQYVTVACPLEYMPVFINTKAK